MIDSLYYKYKIKFFLNNLNNFIGKNNLYKNIEICYNFSESRIFYF